MFRQACMLRGVLAWGAELEMLSCDNYSLSWDSPLPVSLRTLIIMVCNPPEDFSSTGSSLAQLCIAVRGLPALERFLLHAYCSEMLAQLAPLLEALQHCPLLTHLDLSNCGLKGLPEG